MINKTWRRSDAVLIIGALGAALVLALCLLLFRSGGSYAVVTVDGRETARYALSQDRNVRIGDSGQYNDLQIRSGAARMVAASCPDGLCMAQGAVSYRGQSIICLPNRTIVEIVGGGAPDGVAIDEVSR